MIQKAVDRQAVLPQLVHHLLHAFRGDALKREVVAHCQLKPLEPRRQRGAKPPAGLRRQGAGRFAGLPFYLAAAPQQLHPLHQHPEKQLANASSAVNWGQSSVTKGFKTQAPPHKINAACRLGRTSRPQARVRSQFIYFFDQLAHNVAPEHAYLFRPG